MRSNKSLAAIGLIVVVALLSIQTISAPSEPFTITEHTEYGLTENTVYVTIKENLGKSQTINISNIFKNDTLTAKISYKSVLLNQSYQSPVYAWTNNSLGKYKTTNVSYWNVSSISYDNQTLENGTNITIFSVTNITLNKTNYLDDSGSIMPCDYVLGDKSCLKKWSVVGNETKYGYLPIPDLNEKVVLSGLKIEQKQEGIPLPKDSEIQIIYKVKHPPTFGITVPNDVNKYNIMVCSLSGECSTLDPTWWNNTWVYRYDSNWTGGNYTVSLNISNNTVSFGNTTHINVTCKQDNCTDIRFTNDNATELSYWRETNTSTNGTGYGLWWVNVTNGTINLYSGATGVSDASNVTNAFEFADQLSLTKAGTDSADITLDSNTKTSIVSNSNNNAWAYRNLGKYFSNFNIDYEIYKTSMAASGHIGMVDTAGGGTNTGGSAVANGLWAAGDTSGKYFISHSTAGTYALSSQVAVSPDILYYARFSRVGTATTLALYTNSARTIYLTNYPITYTDTAPVEFNTLVTTSTWQATDGSMNYYVQNVRLRKYASPEPAWATWGSQQTQSPSISTYIPPQPLYNITTCGNFFCNISWSKDSSSGTNITDGFNVTVNLTSIFYVTTTDATNYSLNLTLDPHDAFNVTVQSWNNTGIRNATVTMDNTTLSNNPISISGVSATYTVNEGSSVNFDISYTDIDYTDTGTFGSNSTKGTLTNGNYSWNTIIGDSGIYHWYFNVTDNNGSTATQNTTITVQALTIPVDVVNGVYGWRNNSVQVPVNATILEYKNNSILTTVVDLDWDNITSSTWNSKRGAANYSYLKGMRIGIRLSIGGYYNNTNLHNQSKANITTYFPTTTNDPEQSTIQWIEINFTNLSAIDSEKSNYANILAQNISEKSGNKFPVYTTTTVATGLNSNYVKNSPIIYLNIDSNSDFVSKEQITTRGNTTRSRVYSGNESVLSTISAYKSNVLNKLRGTIASSASQLSNTNVTQVSNSSGGYDFIFFNNATITQNITIADVGGFYIDTTNDIMYDLSYVNGILGFNVSAENFSYIINEKPTKIILGNGTSHRVVGQSNTYNQTFSYGGSHSDSYLWAGTNSDIKFEAFDPTYTCSQLYIVTYEWLNTTAVQNYSCYKYIIISDKNPTSITSNVNNASGVIPAGYVSVGDYVDNGGAWLNAKKLETAWWTSRGYNVFIDGIDSAVQTGGNFSPDVKAVISNVTINASKSAICNTYTAYEQFATVCTAVMKESAFSRWDGSVSAPTYTYEDMTLEEQRANYYMSHNIPVLLMSYGDVEDFDKMYFDYIAGAVLYGYDGNNTFRYGQPNFQNVREIKLPNLGTMLEAGYTKSNSSDWNRLYQKGRVHIDPANHTAWVDDNKVVNKITVGINLYSGGAGSGDRNVTVSFNKPNGTFYNITYNNPTLFEWLPRTVDIPVSEYKNHGHYWIYAATRPDAGGFNYLGKSNDARTGNHSFYDTSGTNINTGNEINYTWQSLGNNLQWEINLTINYTTGFQIDTIAQNTITENYSRSSGNRTVTINSSNSYNTSIFTYWHNLTTSNITSILFKATNGSWISGVLPLTNVTDITSDIISWTITTIDGLEYGIAKQVVDATYTLVRFLFPHLSEQQAQVTENIAPTISNISDKTQAENTTIYVDVDGSDTNGDPLIFSTNRTDLFTNFDANTGMGNFTANFSTSGTYYIDFGVWDGAASTNTTKILIITNIPLSITSFTPSTDPSTTSGTSQLFSATLNRSGMVKWYMNGTLIQTNSSCTICNFTNSSAGVQTWNVTLYANDSVDNISRTRNWTISATATTTTSTSSSTSAVSSIKPAQYSKEDETVQTYTTQVLLSGDSARIPIVGGASLKYLNLFFGKAFSGEYKFIVKTYPNYSPSLEGAREYFTVSPQVSITTDSNMELSSSTGISVFQLSTTGWVELKGIKKLPDGFYGVPIGNLGVFAIKEAQVQDVAVEAQQVMYLPQHKNIMQQVKDYVVKARGLIKNPPTVDEIKLEMQKAIREARVQAQAVVREVKAEVDKLEREAKAQVEKVRASANV